MVFFRARDRQILLLYAAGESVAEMSEEIELCEATVNLHLRHIVTHAGLTHRDQLRAWQNQNPKAMVKGGRGKRGLHEYSVACGCAGCRIHRGEPMPLAA
jgi:DNA-binding CsgD family transcriptional regulator